MTGLGVSANGQLGRALSVVLSERGITFRGWGSQGLDIRPMRLTLQYIRELIPGVIVNAAAWT